MKFNVFGYLVVIEVRVVNNRADRILNHCRKRGLRPTKLNTIKALRDVEGIDNWSLKYAKKEVEQLFEFVNGVVKEVK